MEQKLGADGFPLCAVCKGEKKDHGEGKSIHAYTTTPGGLEAANRSEQKSGPQAVFIPPGGVHSPQAMGRLLEVLLEKGVISAPDALYVLGVGTKPNPESETSHPFYQPTPGAGY